jgi:hypothetical protein
MCGDFGELAGALAQDAGEAALFPSHRSPLEWPQRSRSRVYSGQGGETSAPRGLLIRVAPLKLWNSLWNDASGFAERPKI